MPGDEDPRRTSSSHLNKTSAPADIEDVGETEGSVERCPWCQAGQEEGEDEGGGGKGGDENSEDEDETAGKSEDEDDDEPPPRRKKKKKSNKKKKKDTCKKKDPCEPTKKEIQKCKCDCIQFLREKKRAALEVERRNAYKRALCLKQCLERCACAAQDEGPQDKGCTCRPLADEGVQTPDPCGPSSPMARRPPPPCVPCRPPPPPCDPCLPPPRPRPPPCCPCPPLPPFLPPCPPQLLPPRPPPLPPCPPSLPPAPPQLPPCPLPLPRQFLPDNGGRKRVCVKIPALIECICEEDDAPQQQNWYKKGPNC